MGTPSVDEWQMGYQLASSISLVLPQYPKKDLK